MTEAAPVSPGARAHARTRWEIGALWALGLLTCALLPVSINSVPGGLPAHPLFVHVPVIFIPLAAVGALVLAARPRWLAGDAGPWVGLATVIALGSLNLTLNAGGDLRTDLGLNNPSSGPIARIINTHATYAGQLQLIFIVFTVFYLIVLTVHATGPDAPLGWAAGDRLCTQIRSQPAAMMGLRALTALLALACLVWVYRTGDEGAKAVWYARLHGGQV